MRDLEDFSTNRNARNAPSDPLGIRQRVDRQGLVTVWLKEEQRARRVFPVDARELVIRDQATLDVPEEHVGRARPPALSSEGD